MIANLGLACAPLEPLSRRRLPATSWLSRLDGQKHTIRNMRPDIRELCPWDHPRFGWWRVLSGARYAAQLAARAVETPA